MVKVIVTGIACQDCALIIANDDDSGVADPVAHRAQMARLRVEGLVPIVTCDGEGDHVDFSYERCDTCGSALAGSRCPVAWLSPA